MPLPQPEESIHIQTKDSLEIKKIRFEINRIKLPIGIEDDFGIVRHPGASLAVPITNNGEVIILRQYRFAVSQRILEFPAGTLEAGEDPLTSMKRELAEESGYQAKQWDHLGEMFPCPGYSDEIIHLFLARDLTKLPERPQGDPDEDLEVLHMNPKDLEKIISNGEEALDGKSITAWHRACHFLSL